MALSFTSFTSINKNKGGKVKFDRRTVRTKMSIQESTRLRIVEEIIELRDSGMPNISISSSEEKYIIDKVASYPTFTIINTKLAIICISLMKNINPFVEKEFGKKVVEYETEIFKAFNVTDETKKMKLKEDIMIYSQYINFMENNVEEVSEYESEEEYESD